MHVASEQMALLDRARALHERIITFDSHIDIPLGFGGPGMRADEDGPGAFDLAKVERGRLSAAALSIHAALARPGPESGAAGREEHERRYKLITNIAADFPERARIVTSPEALRAAAREGCFAIVLSLQNAAPFEGLASLDLWHERGVAMLDFAFIGNNRWSDSARPYPFIGQGLHSGGLSALGKEAVERLNDLGIIIDVSQISSEAVGDVVARSSAPVIASHAAPRAKVEVGRNLSDADMGRIAHGGGVVHVVGFAPYLLAPDAAMQARVREVWRRFGLAAPTSLADLMSVNDPETTDWDDDRFLEFLHVFHDVLELDKPTATVADYVDAIDYAVATIGVDHVGIGSDFNHGSGVRGWMTVGDNLNITAELLRRGYSEADIGRLWGENFLRAWRQVLDDARPHPSGAPLKSGHDR